MLLVIMVQKDCNMSQTNKVGAIYTICVLFVFDAVGITVFCTAAVKLLLPHKADLTLRKSMVNGCCWKFYKYLATQEIPCS